MFLDIMGRMVIGYGGLAHNILDDARKKLGNNK
jgi:hypothetical protein